MKLLLDTHLLLWAASGSARLSKAARSSIADPSNELLFSAASIWEIAIKAALGREDFQTDARLLRRALLENGYSELPITGEHAETVDRIAAGHKDPFDRILIAQATVEGITFLTNDRRLAAHGAPARRV